MRTVVSPFAVLRTFFVAKAQESLDIECDLLHNLSHNRKIINYSCAPIAEVEGEMTDGQTKDFARFQT
jgi:hypothetical protein